MDYSNYFGYYPLAPQLAPAMGAAPSATAAQPGDGSLTDVFAGNSVGFSTSFAVAGWLAAIIIGFAAYRIFWEMGD